MNQSAISQSPTIIKKFLGYLQTVKGKSPKTIDEYFLDLRTFFRYIKIKFGMVDTDVDFNTISIEDIDIDTIKKITLTDVFEYMEYISRNRHNSAVTRNRKVCSLRMFFKYITNKIGELDTDPLKELETASIGKRLPKFLTLDQSKALLDVVLSCGDKYKYRDYCILMLFLNCGIRLSELVGINVGDIRDDGSLRIIGKGNKERIIYINDACKVAIENYIKVRTIDGVKDKNALFISRNKNRLSQKTVQHLVGKYLELAGLGGMGYSVHKLRHTAATLMYQEGGVDIRILKDILGHQNLGTTEIYTHVCSKQIKDAVDANPLSKIKLAINDKN